METEGKVALRLLGSVALWFGGMSLFPEPAAIALITAGAFWLGYVVAKG
jgi:hypothetical protein